MVGLGGCGGLGLVYRVGAGCSGLGLGGCGGLGLVYMVGAGCSGLSQGVRGCGWMCGIMYGCMGLQVECMGLRMEKLGSSCNAYDLPLLDSTMTYRTSYDLYIISGSRHQVV